MKGVGQFLLSPIQLLETGFQFGRRHSVTARDSTGRNDGPMNLQAVWSHFKKVGVPVVSAVRPLHRLSRPLPYRLCLTDIVTYALNLLNFMPG